MKPSYSLTLALAALLAGCQRAPQAAYVSSEAVQQLDDELQDAVRSTLARYCGTPQNPRQLGESDASDRLLLGQAVYEKRCQPCHGTTGDGRGPAVGPDGDWLNPLPRDYRRGIFKFTSTPYGSRPRRGDLVRTVRRGVAGTSMPSFALLPDAEVDAVVEYVMALSMRGELETLLVFEADSEGELDPDNVEAYASEVRGQWDAVKDEVVLAETRMPEMTQETILAGGETFLKRECYKCHGRDGRGGSAGGVQVGTDVWGHTTAAADLSSGMLHGGQRPIDIYRRIYSGINGTPMPAFKDIFSQEPDTVWHLVHFVLYLADQRRHGEWNDFLPEELQAMAKEFEQPLPADEGAAAPAEVPSTPDASSQQ